MTISSITHDHKAGSNDGLLNGKTALLTGSTGGLGRAMAEALAKHGCNLILHGLEPEATVRRVLEEIGIVHSVRVAYMQVDLTRVRDIESMMDQAEHNFGGIDVLVNNAVMREFGSIETLSVDNWNNALAVNVSAPFHLIRRALPVMRVRGWGRIFNMTSVYGQRAVPNRVDYVTSKTAIMGLTRAVAVETINQGITCNAICPGSVLTPSINARVGALMQTDGIQDKDKATKVFLAGKQPTGRFVDANHVGDLMVFLCGPAGRDITGAMLPIEGGWLAG